MNNEKNLVATNWIKQPFNMTFLKGDIDRLQLSIIISLMELMQDELETILSGKLTKEQIQPSLFPDGEIKISVPLSAIGVNSKYYNRVEDAIDRLISMRFECDEVRDGQLYKAYHNLFKDMYVPKKEIKDSGTGTKQIRQQHIDITFNENAVGYFFDMRQYTKFLKEVVMNCRCSYAARMYQFISTYAYRGKWEVSYMEFRKLLGLDAIVYDTELKKKIEQHKHPLYANFKSRVLLPSQKELKELADQNKANYYFEYEEVYKPGVRRGTPEGFVFHIYTSEYGKLLNDNSTKCNIDSPVGNQLKSIGFKQAEIISILSSIDTDKIDSVFNELVRLSAYVNNPDNGISHKVAYVRKSIQKYIQESIPVADEIKESESMVATDVMANQPVITPEDQRKLNALGSAMHTFMKADDFLAWYCQAAISAQDDSVVAKFPDKEMAAAFQEKYGELFTDNVKQIFWLGYKAVIE